MNKNYFKLKIIYLPFIIISLINIIICNILKWILTINHIILNDNWFSLFIPFSISILTLYIFVYKKLKLLKINFWRKNQHLLYFIIISILNAITILFSQEYIEKKTFGIKHVQNCEEIKLFKNELYFSIESYKTKVDSLFLYHEEKIKSSTRYRYQDEIEYRLYLTKPMDKCSNIWYSSFYSETVGNNQKSNDYFLRNFIKRNKEKFKNENKIHYFKNVNYSTKINGFLKAINKGNNEKKSIDIFLMTEKGSFTENLSYSLSLFLYTLFTEVIIVFILVIIPKLNTAGLKKRKANTG
ncbi:hypothetical protein QVZ41_13950 [Wenyingzhuangia sp. chi5]|uniref:Uncharacterized protein n=1 Tax=Wenyingzhuangia gilva TaxID=3057677 RepID=A0ABT8VVJ7_9FLAO|nr:hypothetical protein [Wenyingzhuangia sp. chi5]MDO3695950.1 hypothetical protein [Wenyingzhuangia sp. chi5]